MFLTPQVKGVLKCCEPLWPAWLPFVKEDGGTNRKLRQGREKWTWRLDFAGDEGDSSLKKSPQPPI